MGLENQLVDSAILWGADYYGVADLSVAQDAILEQGGAEIAEYPRSISIGIALFHPIVNQLPRRQERAVAVGYRSHCYDIINARLDLIISRLASVLQHGGHRAYPVAASKRVDDDGICGIISHKLSAHLAGLGWIGKSCLLITPDRGPRVRLATVLTDAPLETKARPMDGRCGHCRDCIDICPVKAFTGRPFRAEEPRAVRFDAGKCDRYFSKMKKNHEETAVCGLCLYACQYGRQ